MNNDETPLEFSSKNIKRLGTLLLPPGWDAVHRRVTPNIKRAGTHLLGWREALLEKNVFPKNTTLFPWQGLDPGSLDVEACALTMRSPRVQPSYLPT